MSRLSDAIKSDHAELRDYYAVCAPSRLTMVFVRSHVMLIIVPLPVDASVEIRPGRW